MSESNLDDIPNPFAAVEAEGRRFRFQMFSKNSASGEFDQAVSWKSRLGQLLWRGGIIVVLFLTITAVSTRAPTFIANHLCKDFPNLDPLSQKQRLIQFDSLGIAGTDGLFLGYAEAPDVSQLSDQMLRARIDGWSNNEFASSHKSSRAFLNAAKNSWTELSPEHRRPLYRLLLDASNKWQSITPASDSGQANLATLVRTHDAIHRDFEIAVKRCENDLGFSANSIAQSSANAISGGSSTSSVKPDSAANEGSASNAIVLRGSSFDALGSRSLATGQLAEQLPTPMGDFQDSWTDWPPANEDDRLSGPTPDAKILDNTIDNTIQVSNTNSQAAPESDLVRLEPTAKVILRKIDQGIRKQSQPVEATNPSIKGAYGERQPNNTAQPTLSMAVKTYDDRTLFDLVSSEDPALREAVELELLSRDYDPIDLDLARMSQSSNVSDRISMVEQLPRLQTRDPRPWLRHMLNDEEREVRLRVVSIIASMDDPEGWLLLRMHQAAEEDRIVLARLDRLLKSDSSRR